MKSNSLKITLIAVVAVALYIIWPSLLPVGNENAAVADIAIPKTIFPITKRKSPSLPKRLLSPKKRSAICKIRYYTATIITKTKNLSFISPIFPTRHLFSRL